MHEPEDCEEDMLQMGGCARSCPDSIKLEVIAHFCPHGGPPGGGPPGGGPPGGGPPHGGPPWGTRYVDEPATEEVFPNEEGWVPTFEEEDDFGEPLQGGTPTGEPSAGEPPASEPPAREPPARGMPTGEPPKEPPQQGELPHVECCKT